MWYDGDIVLKQIYLIFILNITHITNKVIWIWANLSILSRNLSILSKGITLLYGWIIVCCFFPCFLILASGQFLNIAGWILFYATIHVYTVFFLWMTSWICFFVSRWHLIRIWSAIVEAGFAPRNIWSLSAHDRAG